MKCCWWCKWHGSHSWVTLGDGWKETMYIWGSSWGLSHASIYSAPTFVFTISFSYFPSPWGIVSLEISYNVMVQRLSHDRRSLGFQRSDTRRNSKNWTYSFITGDSVWSPAAFSLFLGIFTFMWYGEIKQWQGVASMPLIIAFSDLINCCCFSVLNLVSLQNFFLTPWVGDKFDFHIEFVFF